MQRPKHAGGTLQSDKRLFVVNCAIAGLNAVRSISVLHVFGIYTDSGTLIINM